MVEFFPDFPWCFYFFTVICQRVHTSVLDELYVTRFINVVIIGIHGSVLGRLMLQATFSYDSH